MNKLAARAAQLQLNPKSIFISYSHESPEHEVWVYSLGLQLRKHGFEVIVDEDENPRPEEPKMGADWKKSLDYQAGELAEKYLWELHGPITNLGSIAMRPSPILPMELSPEWEEYLDNIYSVIRLIGSCKNIILVNTPKYVNDCVPSTGSSTAGWVFEEYQHLLRCLRSNADKRVISIFRYGEKALSGCKWKSYKVIDFSSTKISYHESFKLLLNALEN